MSTYSEECLEELADALGNVPKKRDGLIAGLFATEIANKKARVFLEQGVMRRISILAESIEQLFSVLPPETSELPDKGTLDLATLILQANIFNTYGVLDCWAHVWANEFNVRDKKNRPLGNNKVGLGKRFPDLRAAMTAELVALVELREEWIENLVNYRHALAHRIPLYIPPNMVDPRNQAEYEKLLTEWHNTLDSDRRDTLDAQMKELSHFKAFMVHDFEDSIAVAFHAQVLANFHTIEELSFKFQFELYEKKKQILRVR